MMSEIAVMADENFTVTQLKAILKSICSNQATKQL